MGKWTLAKFKLEIYELLYYMYASYMCINMQGRWGLGGGQGDVTSVCKLLSTQCSKWPVMRKVEEAVLTHIVGLWSA